MLRGLKGILLYWATGVWREEIHVLTTKREVISIETHWKKLGWEVVWVLPEERKQKYDEGFENIFSKKNRLTGRRWRIERSDCAMLLKRKCP